jgi:hypothetical protein
MFIKQLFFRFGRKRCSEAKSAGYSQYAIRKSQKLGGVVCILHKNRGELCRGSFRDPRRYH